MFWQAHVSLLSIWTAEPASPVERALTCETGGWLDFFKPHVQFGCSKFLQWTAV